jgi:hypothetical protein
LKVIGIKKAAPKSGPLFKELEFLVNFWTPLFYTEEEFCLF